MKFVDTSVYLRNLSTTTSHVETDIVDASGHYKPFEKYDTLWVPDPSEFKASDPRQLRNTHLYTCIDPGTTQKEVNAVFKLDPSLTATCPRVWNK